jgi:DsbC/DsbD-like thiol-disulfide interchange protein
VAQAFEAAPAAARSGFRLTDTRKAGETLTVTGELPQPGEAAELFLAAPEGYSFGPPTRLADKGGKTGFSVPLYEQPDKPAPGTMAAYTLVQNGKAVAGTISLP